MRSAATLRVWFTNYALYTENLYTVLNKRHIMGQLSNLSIQYLTKLRIRPTYNTAVILLLGVTRISICVCG